MSFAWSTAKKDLARIRRDPVGLVMWIGLPLAIGFLVSLASGGQGGVSPQAHVLVADLDDSFLSGMLLGALSQDAAGSFIRAEQVSLEDGRRRIDRGDGTALIVIPEGFSEAVLREEPVTLELVKNPSQTILPAIVEEALGILTDGTFYLHRLIGEDLQAFADGPADGADVFPDRVIADFSVKVNQTVERLSTFLFPPVIELEIVSGDAEEDADEEAAGPPLALFFLPGLLFMSLLFMSQGLAQDLWTERGLHTLRRVVVAPQRIGSFLLGKFLYAAMLMLLVIGIALVAAWAYFGLDWKNLPLAVVWSVFSGLVLLAILTVIMLHASSEKMAGILTMAIIFPLMMVGGSFFPFEAMPPGMAAVGKLTPNGWALEQLKAILLDRVEPGRLTAAFAGLLGVGALLFQWSAVRLRSGFARG